MEARERDLRGRVGEDSPAEPEHRVPPLARLASDMGNQAFAAAAREARLRGRASRALQRTPVDELVADKPWIYTCTVSRYEDDRQFGHEITIDLALNSPDQLYWLEKTDRPYVAGMQPGEWNNMYGLAGQSSDVFTEWREEGGRTRMKFVDPPSIRKDPDNERTLEFYLHFVGEENAIVIKASQFLKTDGAGQPVKWDFACTEQQIAENDVLTNPLW